MAVRNVKELTVYKKAYTCWDFALDCGYISADEHAEMTALNQEIGKMLGAMIGSPEKFLLRPDSCPLTPDSCPLTPDHQ